MTLQSGRGLHRNRRHVLIVEALEDRRLLSGAVLSGGVPLTTPAALSPTTPALTATLGSGVLGSPDEGAAGAVSVGGVGRGGSLAGSLGVGGGAGLPRKADAP